MQFPRDAAVTASLRSQEIKQCFAEVSAPAGQQCSCTSASLKEKSINMQTLAPRWHPSVPQGPSTEAAGDMMDERGQAAGGEAAAASSTEQCRALGCQGGSREQQLARGERLCTSIMRARSQMVALPWTFWVAFRQCYPSSLLTMTTIALMTNSGSHMPLISPSLAFPYKTLQTL